MIIAKTLSSREFKEAYIKTLRRTSFVFLPSAITPIFTPLLFI